MPKLQAKISKKLHDEIIRISIKIDKNKGKTLQYLVRLALSEPAFEKTDFGTSEEMNCTLEMSATGYSETSEYRLLHGLDKKVSFFRDALARGVTIHLSQQENGFGLGDKGPE